jgi:phosphoribosyl 1,2-cyclic phosphate phosphodiesterase
MELRVLGSGGNTPIPMPTCSCGVCAQAREEGVPYSRGGNSLYLPALSAVVDAPEFVFSALNREGVDALDYILLTHWHPDHVNGLRVLQARDRTAHDSYVGAMAEGGPTIVTTRQVYERTRDVFGQLEFFVDETGMADVQFIDEQPLMVDGVEVRAVPYALEDEALDATAFVLDDGETTVVIASDDARYLDESDLPAEIDLAVFECGLFDEDPDGERLLTETDWTVLDDELRHGEVLDRIDRVDPDRALLTEIEHLTGRSYDHFRELESRPEYDGIRFAHDGLQLDVT